MNPTIEAVWTDAATGYRCLVVSHPWFCGYVQVPEDHPWHGTGYSGALCGDHEGQSCWEHTPEAIIGVHGGLTFSGVPWEQEGGHWFGFDCAHCDDYVEYASGISSAGHVWTLDEVQAECAMLAAQLYEQAVRS